MTAKEIQSIVDDYHYWDARVIKLECNHFADEVKLIYDNEGDTILYNFSGCYKVFFDHVKQYEKQIPIRDMDITQIPYFIQDVEIGEIVEDGLKFYVCKINLFPLYLELLCKDIQILKS